MKFMEKGKANDLSSLSLTLIGGEKMHNSWT